MLVNPEVLASILQFLQLPPSHWDAMNALEEGQKTLALMFATLIKDMAAGWASRRMELLLRLSRRRSPQWFLQQPRVYPGHLKW